MKSFLLIGLGRFGRHIAMQLNAQGHQIMAVDSNEDRVNDVLDIVTNAQIGDSTNAEFLKALGVRNFDVCIVAISGDFQSSLETTSLLKELGAQLVVSRAERDVQAKFLLRNGADEVLYPEKQLAKWAAVRYGSSHLVDYVELDANNAIMEVPTPENWVGPDGGRPGYPQEIRHQPAGHQEKRFGHGEHCLRHRAARRRPPAGAGGIPFHQTLLPPVSRKGGGLCERMDTGFPDADGRLVRLVYLPVSGQLYGPIPQGPLETPGGQPARPG